VLNKWTSLWKRSPKLGKPRHGQTFDILDLSTRTNESLTLTFGSGAHLRGTYPIQQIGWLISYTVGQCRSLGNFWAETLEDKPVFTERWINFSSAKRWMRIAPTRKFCGLGRWRAVFENQGGFTVMEIFSFSIREIINYWSKIRKHRIEAIRKKSQSTEI